MANNFSTLSLNNTTNTINSQVEAIIEKTKKLQDMTAKVANLVSKDPELASQWTETSEVYGSIGKTLDDKTTSLVKELTDYVNRTIENERVYGLRIDKTNEEFENLMAKLNSL